LKASEPRFISPQRVPSTHRRRTERPANKKSTGGGRGSGGTQTRPVTIAIGRRDGKYIDLRAVERMQASHVPGGCHHLRSVARSFAMC
jgi:hypothetical protein